MTLRKKLARALLGSGPEVVRLPLIREDVLEMRDRVRAHRGEGMHAANLSCDEALALCDELLERMM